MLEFCCLAREGLEEREADYREGEDFVHKTLVYEYKLNDSSLEERYASGEVDEGRAAFSSPEVE